MIIYDKPVSQPSSFCRSAINAYAGYTMIDMRIGLRPHQYVASALLVAAGFLYFDRPAGDLRRWKPLNIPISLNVGIVESPVFRVGLKTSYRLLVAAERKIEFKRLECLLGMAYCHSVPDVINITWKVLHNDVAVASGSSLNFRGGFYSDMVAREIGAFSAQKDQAYRIVLTIARDGSELDAASPRLLVETQPWEWERAVVGSIIWQCAAVLLVIIAALMIGLPPAFHFLSRRFTSVER
jgi:hypothetical protein